MGFSLVIQPNGEYYTINLKPGGDHLAQMREHLDCRLVDVVSLGDGLDMWLDDEGVFNHEINLVATALARRYGHTHQPYFGPVLICSVTAHGDSVDMSNEAIEALAAVLAKPGR